MRYEPSGGKMPDNARFANGKGLIRQKAIAYAGYLPWRVA